MFCNGILIIKNSVKSPGVCSFKVLIKKVYKRKNKMIINYLKARTSLAQIKTIQVIPEGIHLHCEFLIPTGNPFVLSCSFSRFD